MNLSLCATTIAPGHRLLRNVIGANLDGKKFEHDLEDQDAISPNSSVKKVIPSSPLSGDKIAGPLSGSLFSSSVSCASPSFSASSSSSPSSLFLTDADVFSQTVRPWGRI